MSAIKGQKQSPEHIAKRSTALRGRSLSEEHKAKIGKSNHIANKGRVHTPEAIKSYKIAANRPDKNGTFRKGITPWNKGKKVPQISGANNKNWKGGTQSESRKQRVSFGRYAVPLIFERDDYTCQICFARNGNGKKIILHVDHIKPWAEYPELRFEPSNCRTVCRPCHYYLTFKKDMPAMCKWGISIKWSGLALERIR